MNVTPVQSAPDRANPERILRRLEWRVIRRLDGLLQGDYRTLFFGEGIDFANLREYELTDDIRLIDWNITARMNHPYVRQYMQDREVTCWFLLDLSPSMAFGPVRHSKKEVLTDFVTTLARVLTRNGNRVGAIFYSSQIDRILPPRSGRNQVLRLARELLRSEGKAAGRPTDLSVLINGALNSFKRRSLVILVSDFISQPGWEGRLALLNQKHELIAVRMWDSREEDLPDAGMIVLQDTETSEQIFVDTSNPEFRRRFYEAARRREAALRGSLREAGVDFHSISTEEDLVRALVRMATLRKKRRV
jgi:uncharacterized protein (DUF58 family)